MIAALHLPGSSPSMKTLINGRVCWLVGWGLVLYMFFWSLVHIASVKLSTSVYIFTWGNRNLKPYKKREVTSQFYIFVYKEKVNKTHPYY